MKRILLIGLSMSLALNLGAQDISKKVWASGYARGTFLMDDFDTKSAIEDTVTARKLNSGHVLADLSINVQPNANTELLGQVRVRNDFGGFWGSGVTFDVRQLYLKGVVGGIVRYQLGDFNYKLTPYTFYNNEEELSQNEAEIFSIYRDMMHQDLFYDDNNSWRQQGASIDIGLEFKRFVEELNFNFFSSRVRPSNFTSISDQIFLGTSIGLVQSEKLKLAFNYVRMLDIEETSNSNRYLNNPVFSTALEAKIWKNANYSLLAKGEVGASKFQYENDTLSPILEDYFMDLNIQFNSLKTGLSLDLNYINVGADFRSPGAQTKRIAFTSQLGAYERYGNEQALRSVNMMDLMRDVSLYNQQISPILMAYNPSYGNSNPYGNASPNRSGLKLKLSHKDLKKRWEANFHFNQLSEILGSGTDEIRNFSSWKIESKIDLAKFLNGYQRKIELNASYWSENTSRAEESGLQTVDLSNRMLNLGLNIGLGNNFELLAGLRSLRSDGFDFMPELNVYSEIIDFNEFRTELSEQIYGCGIRYNFSEKVNLSLLYHNFNWKDDLSNLSEYQMNQYSINYIMNF
tara:strand:- start:713 stop:2434 length:1722 start_codon:yes stop_codon:yes gene_type:complete